MNWEMVGNEEWPFVSREIIGVVGRVCSNNYMAKNHL